MEQVISKLSDKESHKESDKERSQIFLKLIKEIEHNHNRVCTINFNSFSTLHPTYQLHIMLYTFSSSVKLFCINNFKEIFKQFSNKKSNLLNLINNMIETNNCDNLDYILQNKDKESKINSDEYKKLKEYALSLRLFDIMRILTKYDSHDFILYDD
jgi:hypothetical protein